MAEITFVKTRHVYDSYTDFWRLVELSGFPTIYSDEFDFREYGVFIMTPMNGDIEEHLQNHIDDFPREAHTILWNLERPDGSAGSVGNYTRRCRELVYKQYFDEIWVSDRRLADQTKHAARFVTLGSDEGLGSGSDSKIFDIVHMSVEVNRRQTIYAQFRKDTIGPNCWPPERDEVLKRSRFALNVHQDNHTFQEPLRFALFAAYELPIISETIYDAYPWSGDTVIFATYDDLPKRTNEVLKSSYGQWREMAKRARKLMCEELQFGKMVRRAVSESVEKWR